MTGVILSDTVELGMVRFVSTLIMSSNRGVVLKCTELREEE